MNLPEGDASQAPRRLIALAGPPGAGKSTLAPALAAHLGAVVVPMDGFHLDNRLLDAAGMRGRKGAPETFDVAGLSNALGRLKAGEGDVILPAFDRDRDAAIAGAIRIGPEDRLLLVEGNYLLCRLPDWADLAQFWDASILLRVPRPVLAARLAARWQGYGLTAEAVAAHLANDLANVDVVTDSAIEPTLHITETDTAEAIAARIAARLSR
ncbi:AAA family ATPase [Paracoccus suum]|uniref:AAA family ATPase n=1 Tax=Paracoccus suum TaxID=2259340 RepID=A0A344PKE6_9RHOB|nr:AAA family ATPase [Paracoccus suum]AXC49851.1 AAA family ATPase [Paracoccus suum]